MDNWILIWIILAQNKKRLSFPAGEILWITDCLEDFVEILKHDQFTLHTHLTTMNVSHQDSWALPQLLLQPFILYYFSYFTEHYFVGNIKSVQNFIGLVCFFLWCRRLLNISEHLVDLRTKISVEIFCLQSTLFSLTSFLLFWSFSLIWFFITWKLRTFNLFIFLGGGLILLKTIVNGKCTISTLKWLFLGPRPKKL